MKIDKKMSIEKRRNQGIILEIQVSSTSKGRVLAFVRDKIRQEKKFYIVTPNPEIILKAQNDSKLKTIINSSDISLPDGIGLAAADKFLSLPNPKNPWKRLIVLFAQGLGVGFSVIVDKKWATSDLKIIKGREMFLELIRLANLKGWKVFLVGDQHKSAQKTREKLGWNYKKVRLHAHTGPNLDFDGESKTEKDRKIERELIENINKVSPQLLFVAFGAPKQEKWIGRHMENLKIGGAMVVGGSFDFISGKAKLPPAWIEEIGFEWLWRLIKQPSRFRRIVDAVIVFSYKVFLHKLNSQNIPPNTLNGS